MPMTEDQRRAETERLARLHRAIANAEQLIRSQGGRVVERVFHSRGARINLVTRHGEPRTMKVRKPDAEPER